MLQPVRKPGSDFGVALVPEENYRKENAMDLAIQGAIWLGAGVTLIMLLSRRRKRRAVR